MQRRVIKTPIQENNNTVIEKEAELIKLNTSNLKFNAIKNSINIQNI